VDAYRGTRAMAAVLPLLAIAACGSDTTEPAPADVSGLYQALSETSAATCTPASAFDILEPTLGDLSLRLRLRVVQSGGQVTLTLEHAEGIDGQPVNSDAQPVIAPIAADGTMRFETHLSDHFTLSQRTFFDETTISTTGRLDAGANPISMMLSSTAIQVYREGDAGAPVFATCTQTQTTTGTRTGA
jgi:hypothetical protein